MVVMLVYVHVKPECVEDFKAASIENAKNSLQEPDVVRFDVIQERDDPTRFVLIEVYRTPEDHPKHRETAHYLAWRDTVADMMAEPRSSEKFVNIFPDDADW